MTENLNDLNRLNEIKILLKTGQISYEEAKMKAKPFISAMNEKIVRISKKFGKKPYLISFGGFMR